MFKRKAFEKYKKKPRKAKKKKKHKNMSLDFSVNVLPQQQQPQRDVVMTNEDVHESLLLVQNPNSLMKEILTSSRLGAAFKEFSESAYLAENILFLHEMIVLEQIKDEQLAFNKCLRLINVFVKCGSPKELNLTSEIRRGVYSKMNERKEKMKGELFRVKREWYPRTDVFKSVENHIHLLLLREVLPNFKNSSFYWNVLAEEKKKNIYKNKTLFRFAGFRLRKGAVMAENWKIGSRGLQKNV